MAKGRGKRGGDVMHPSKGAGKHKVTVMPGAPNTPRMKAGGGGKSNMRIK